MPAPSHTARLFRFLNSVFLLLFCLPVSNAQQPFVTGDSDTTPNGHFHFEFSNQFDLLSRSSFPALKQNTADFELDYGFLQGLEMGIEAPLITILNAADTNPIRPSGIGDTNLSLKYNFLTEQEHDKNVTIDFGIVAGKYVASPRAGIQLGFYIDW